MWKENSLNSALEVIKEWFKKDSINLENGKQKVFGCK